MDIVTVLSTADTGLNLFDRLRRLLPGDALRRHQFGPVIQALRDIYFTPTGTQRVLSILAEGGRPDPTDVTAALTAFNDAEWQVRRQTARMHFDWLERHANLTIEDRLALNKIADDKVHLRRDIQACLNLPGADRPSVSPDRARALLDRILELNRSIEVLERDLLRDPGSR